MAAPYNMFLLVTSFVQFVMTQGRLLPISINSIELQPSIVRTISGKSLLSVRPPSPYSSGRSDFTNLPFYAPTVLEQMRMQAGTGPGIQSWSLPVIGPAPLFRSSALQQPQTSRDYYPNYESLDNPSSINDNVIEGFIDGNADNNLDEMEENWQISLLDVPHDTQTAGGFSSNNSPTSGASYDPTEDPLRQTLAELFGADLIHLYDDSYVKSHDGLTRHPMSYITGTSYNLALLNRNLNYKNIEDESYPFKQDESYDYGRTGDEETAITETLNSGSRLIDLLKPRTWVPSSDDGTLDVFNFISKDEIESSPLQTLEKNAGQRRGRRALDDSVHAEECHAEHLQSCGQPVLKKLQMKDLDMKSRCRIREDFLSCMLARRHHPCPKGKGSSAPDPKLKELRSQLKKSLSTSCFIGYSTPSADQPPK